jgi:hypothetical protein
MHAIRELLEANLAAVRSVAEEQQRMMRALGDARAAWARQLGETRALLFVALRELIVANENEPTRVG